MSALKQRQKSRRLLVQALYSWDVSGTEISAIAAEFLNSDDLRKADADYFREVIFGVAKHLGDIDSAYTPHLDRAAEKLDPVSRAVLRLSCYELLQRIDIPYKVVINEGVNLAKTYGPTDAFKFINGVLDRVAADARAVEVAAARA